MDRPVEGQTDTNSGALPCRALHADAASMLSHCRIGNGQSETGASGCRAFGKKGIKHFFDCLLINPMAGIAYGDNGIEIIPVDRNTQRSSVSQSRHGI